MRWLFEHPKKHLKGKAAADLCINNGTWERVEKQIIY